MKRLFLVTVVAVVVAAVSFAAIVIGARDRPPAPVIAARNADAPSVATTADDQAARPPGTPAGEQSGGEAEEQVAAAAGAPGSGSIAEDAEARAAFDNMVQALRDFGLEVSAATVGPRDEGIVAAMLTVAGPGARVGWRWEMAEAYFRPAESGMFTVTTSGSQTATLTVDGNAAAWSGHLEEMDIEVEPRPSMNGTTVRVVVDGMSMQTESDAPVVSLASGRFGFNLATGSLPLMLTTVSRIELSDLVLPALAGEPFGSRVRAVDARVDVRPHAAGPPAVEPTAPVSAFSVPNLELAWGALRLTGKGSIGLDAELRPTGLLEVRLEDPMAALDAVYAGRRLDRDMLAATYSSLLKELVARGAQQALPFTLEIVEGAVLLQGVPYGFDDVELARLPRLLRATGAELTAP